MFAANAASPSSRPVTRALMPPPSSWPNFNRLSGTCRSIVSLPFMFNQICRGAAERRGRRAVRIALHGVKDVRRRAAVLQQHRHQDRAIARQHVERRARSLRIEEHLYNRPELLARDADQLAAEADLVTLALVLDRDRLMRAAVGGTATRCHSRSLSSSSSTSTTGAGSLRRDGG